MTARFYKREPPLFYCAPEGVPTLVPCAFCGKKDLRVIGPRQATYLACPDCGATGPVGNGLVAAVTWYLGRPYGSLPAEAKSLD